MAKKSKRGTRYSAAQKAKILAAAKKEGLTGAQVAKRFGVSTLTFYRWRGPVRSDALKRAGKKRGPGRPKGSGKVKVDTAAVRREVQAQIRKVLPQIIREEVVAALRHGRR
jgi:transposase-like protein